MGQPNPGGSEPEDLDGLLLPGSQPQQSGEPPPGVPGLPGGSAAGQLAPEPPTWAEYQLGMLSGTQQGPPMARSLSEMLLPPVPPPPASGHFRVTLDQAPNAIFHLRRAADVFEAKLDWAESLGQIDPPGVDEVSLDAVRIMQAAAIGPEGSLRMALQQGAAEFRREADALDAQLRAYHQVEELNTPPVDPQDM